MNARVVVTPEVQSLIEAACDGVADDAQLQNLKPLLLTDDAARTLYVDLVNLDAELQWLVGSLHAGDAALKEFITAKQTLPQQFVPAFLSNTLHGTIGYFSHEMPFSFLIGAVFTSLLVLVAWLVPVSGPEEIAKNSSLISSFADSQMEIVGKITGMVDCRWTDINTSTERGNGVPLGRKYALASGLVEITYDTGAKVILQGPVTYEVESKNGGFLLIGKLTGKVENDTAKGFTVRTPTATVTDLGTEFGVEVSPQESTHVCVLQGQVALYTQATGATGIVLKRGQSSLVDARGIVTRRSEAETASYAKTIICKLPRTSRPAFVSLTDLVAGGNGFGDRAFWGINAQDASVIPEPGAIRFIDSSGKYQHYSGFPQIDGVFIPDGRVGPVQLDSAGHTFALPKTCGQTCQWGVGAYKGRDWEPPPSARQFSRQDAAATPMLLLHANAGVTFDLSAIRTSADGRNATRFQSMVRNCNWDPGSSDCVADVWVFIDGQLRFNRMKLYKKDGPQEIDIPLKPNDRFLTLVSTDGGDRIWCDEICFLKPRVLLETDSQEGGALGGRTK